MLKRIVKLTISMFVGAGDWLGIQVRRLLGRPPRGTCVILSYHGVTTEQRTRFCRQMDVVARHAKLVRTDIDSLPHEGGRYAAVTFDDGLEDIIENALPELKKRGIPSTLFIVTEGLGAYPGWDYMGGEDVSNVRVLSEQNLRELPSELVTIGSHTMTHAFLPSLQEDRLRQEVFGSRTKLEKILNQEVKLLSFPYGEGDSRAIERCREAGYERVFTNLPVLAFSAPKEFVTGRVGVSPTDWPLEFRLKLAGAYRWLPYAFAWKRRILSRVHPRPIQRVARAAGERRSV